MSSGIRQRVRAVILSVGIAALLFGGYEAARAIGLPGQVFGHVQKVALTIHDSAAPRNLGDFKDGFASAIDPALPAVVNISSTKVVKQQNVPNPFADPFFRQFFGNQFGPAPSGPHSQTEREHALGSGVIVNPDGYILTNNHVVSGATDIEVFTQDKKKYTAKVIGTDPNTDIAVLKIEDHHLPTLALGDSAKLKVGDIVFAIGDPMGVGETATMGIVSATGRGLGGTIERYEDFIQTDASINPGNSGGALIDARGNLIGINTAILTGNGGGGNEGIGFAIPINMARNVMQQIVEHGKVTRGYLGVTIQAVDPDMAKAFGLSHGGGALIGDVRPSGPAAKAGIARGDIITQSDGQAISGPDDLSVRVSQTAPGTTVHLQVVRDGKPREVAVQLGEYPQEDEQARNSGEPGKSAALDGVQVQTLNRTLARELKLPAGTAGVAVTAVDPSSPAAAAGLQEGDVIQEANHQPVHSVAEYEKALEGAGNQPVLLLVNRGGNTRFIVVASQ